MEAKSKMLQVLPELEKGSRKFNCPGCGAARKFKRYVDRETGGYISETVGRCERINSCGYHKTPKEYFAENPPLKTKKSSTKRKTNAATPYGFANAPIQTRKPDHLDFDILQKTLANYRRNYFVQFLLELFFEDVEIVWQAINNYCIGSTRDGETVFWYINRERRVCKGRIMRFDQFTGHRSFIKSWVENGETVYQKADSVESRLKKKGLLKEDFETDKQMFFGEHLLPDNPLMPVAIVEAEKTAVFCAICFPEFIWLAAGSKQNLKAEKLMRLNDRNILLCPDADGYQEWQSVAHNARELGLTVNVSDEIENRATVAEKYDGNDLADYLIDEQRQINQHNSYVDKYNATVDRVLRDEQLIGKPAESNQIWLEQTVQNIISTITKQ